MYFAYLLDSCVFPPVRPRPGWLTLQNAAQEIQWSGRQWGALRGLRERRPKYTASPDVQVLDRLMTTTAVNAQWQRRNLGVSGKTRLATPQIGTIGLSRPCWSGRRELNLLRSERFDPHQAPRHSRRRYSGAPQEGQRHDHRPGRRHFPPGFVYVTFKLGVGRTEDQKNKVCNDLFEMMKAHFAATAPNRGGRGYSTQVSSGSEK